MEKLTKGEWVSLRDQLLERSSDWLSNLYDRWQDEKEYEDFRDYETEMKKLLLGQFKAVTFAKGTKRPFGFKFQYKNLMVSMTINDRVTNHIERRSITVKGTPLSATFTPSSVN